MIGSMNYQKLVQMEAERLAYYNSMRNQPSVLGDATCDNPLLKGSSAKEVNKTQDQLLLILEDL